ncbi:MAG: tRNA (guanosine(37)-N1)-methyltransferase TrmD [Bacteroidetes bacterium]|nr:tRNA (guanosine(37)-N1)-methyltransferase TrmD [Bacteroidota bacterium]
MLRFDVLSAIPALMTSPLQFSILKRAISNNLVDVKLHNLHDYTHDRYKTIDDYAFGGQAGMVLKPEPIFECLDKLSAEQPYDEIIFMTPDGVRFTQQIANELSLKKNIAIIAGHYKGIDQRVRDHWVSREISIGDYVVTGGELPALILIDAVTRLLPGALGDSESALTDSFQTHLLDSPVYTRPSVYRNMPVPDVLRSGDHKKIEEWQQEQAIQKTKQRRPDLLEP